MSKRNRMKLRPSPGTVLGTVAVVFALTGVAVAAPDGKVQTSDIASGAVTGKKIASKSIKSGKIADGKIKAISLAPGVIPEVPNQAYGRINKSGNTAAPATGAVGITGVASGGVGVICLDLAVAPASGSATIAQAGGPNRPGATAELAIGSALGCAAPYNDAAVSTRAPTIASPPVQPLDEQADRDVYVTFIGG